MDLGQLNVDCGTDGAISEFKAVRDGPSKVSLCVFRPSPFLSLSTAVLLIRVICFADAVCIQMSKLQDCQRDGGLCRPCYAVGAERTRPILRSPCGAVSCQ